MSLTSDHLYRACEVAFPDRAGLTIESVNPLTSSHHPMAVFFARWEGIPLQPLILRRYPGPVSWHTPGEIGRAAREFALLKWLADQDFMTPPVYAAGRDSAGDWMIMGAVSGRNWWLPFGMVDFERVLPSILRDYVRRLARLHALDISTLPADLMLPTIKATDILLQFRERVRPAHDVDAVAALDQLGTLMTRVEEREPRLINVDADIANVLVSQSGQMVAWVDWDDASLGDPRWDIGALVSALRGPYQLDALASRAVADYARETVRPVKHLAAWTALHAVLQWVMCVWLRDETKRGRKPEFPSAEQFINLHDSHRAWAVQALNEAQQEKDSEP